MTGSQPLTSEITETPVTSQILEADRLVTSSSSEMYPKLGMSVRQRVTRSLVDKSSLGNARNGMPHNKTSRRRGADPPKNELGRVGGFSSSGARWRYFNSGNGFFIAANFFNRGFGIFRRVISYTRSCCSSAAMTFVTPRSRDVM